MNTLLIGQWHDIICYYYNLYTLVFFCFFFLEFNILLCGALCSFMIYLACLCILVNLCLYLCLSQSLSLSLSLSRLNLFQFEYRKFYVFSFRSTCACLRLSTCLSIIFLGLQFVSLYLACAIYIESSLKKPPSYPTNVKSWRFFSLTKLIVSKIHHSTSWTCEYLARMQRQILSRANRHICRMSVNLSLLNKHSLI